MTTKHLENLESYFDTDNEHWNERAFSTFCDAIKESTFEDLEVPLMLLSRAIELFSEHYLHPIKAVHLFTAEVDKEAKDNGQKLFVFEQVYDYLRYSEFEKADLSDIQHLLKAHISKMSDYKPEYNKPLVGDIRDTLKEVMQKELKSLPEYLEGLEPMQRLNILCKLMPFVVPKVDSIHSEAYEPKG